jgi:gentisate 1,2-dioxygenase
MIWLDGLDIPTVRFYAASFAERLPDGAMAHPETAPPGDTLARYGRNLRPFAGSAAARRPPRLPLFHYPYAEWRESLAALARAGAPDAQLGHALEFVNPADGGPVMPTIAAHVRLLPGGFATAPRRATDATVFVVVEGEGSARIGDQALALGPRDIFVVPSWTTLALQARSDLVLFGYSDAAAQRALGLWREAPG